MTKYDPVEMKKKYEEFLSFKKAYSTALESLKTLRTYSAFFQKKLDAAIESFGELRDSACDESLTPRVKNIISECDYDLKYSRFNNDIPQLKFPPHWKVKIIFPFGRAVVRFIVSTNKNTHVSVYLDGFDNLGHMGRPYWEIYPDSEWSESRCYMEETDTLIKMIDASLKAQEKENDNK